MSEGYSQPVLRTGYEYVMPYRVSSLYCTIAADDGEVLSKTDKLLTVKYKDGSTKSIQLGTQYGRMEGSVYPHTVVSDLSAGQKFKASQHLAYNDGFFEKDWLDPTRLVMKFSRNVTVALTMNNEVFEDSSAISRELGEQMRTSVIKEKIFVLSFKKNLLNIMPEGSELKFGDILFTAVDDDTDFKNLSDSTVEMLQGLASMSPKSKYEGILDRLEIKYNGELSDMSPTLRKLATRLDKRLQEESSDPGQPRDNQVTSKYRSEGKNLAMDTLELKVFIRVDLTAGVGDKGVFANQMKSVISSVFTGEVTTESGQKVDAYFSYRSILNRQVTSPITMGTTIRLVKHVSRQLADVYFAS